MTRTKEDRLEIANTLIAQLGGRLSAMIGAYNLDATETGLKFRFKARAANGSNCCVIDLTADDLYTVKFFSIRGMNVKLKGEFEGVYAEDLCDLFYRETKLELRMPKVYRVHGVSI